jgi:hypothetical protein
VVGVDQEFQSASHLVNAVGRSRARTDLSCSGNEDKHKYGIVSDGVGRSS